MKKGTILFGILAVLFLFTACGAKEDIDNNISAENAVQIENSSTEESSESANETVPTISATEKKDDLSVGSALVAEQILTGTDGDIHYSYYLPKDFDESKKYPMMVVMPGYDMMWFGADSFGSNLNWRGFLAWTELGEDMIVVSAQLTDWRKKSARQAVELTEYFLDNFPVDVNRVYAAGYSAGGKLCRRPYPCAQTYMQLIYMVLHNGTEPLSLLRKIALLFISLWQKMTSIMVHRKQGTLIRACMKPIGTPNGNRHR